MAQQNVVQFDSQPNRMAARQQIPPAEPQQRGAFIRFLLWIGLLMDTSTQSGETRWNSGFLFILALLFGTIFAGFIILLGIGGVFYLDMKEDWRGEAAWREKKNYDQMVDSKRKCEVSVSRQRGLIEYAKLTNQKPPSDLLQIEDCGQMPQAQQTQEH